ncbi:MAG: homocysteine biosynthesis protein [Desulfohalobiaceae bacterium]|nr:homocysteine biosynthesis protein [Desulfohalobiaceae bacterium]
MSEVRVKKSIEEINRRINQGKAVVVTADEMVDIVAEEGPKNAFKKVDVVTTGTFGTMCSSGAFINFGHTKPKIRASKVWFNEVEAYGGIAAVDCFLGATQVKEEDPLNKVHPGRFEYGGGHVIEDLIAGRSVRFKARGYGTDCYPLRELEKEVCLQDLRNAYLYNPRNAYQNYNTAANLSERTIYTYLGILRPNLGNVNYSTSGQLSPLLNDPFYWTIGVGTRIFLGGAPGVVSWAGTQHDPDVKRGENGVVREGAGTLAVTGDMKEMSPEFIRGASIVGYGCSLMVGLGVPVPIINEDMAYFTGVANRDLFYQVIDYGLDYPNGINRSLGEVSYEQLMSGSIELQGRTVPTAPLASYSMAGRISRILKTWILENRFSLGVPQVPLPTTAFDRDRYPKLNY